MSDAAMSVSDRQAKTLKDLTDTYRVLNEKKVTVEAELRGARKTLETLTAESKKKFGMDNPEDLRAEFARRTKANDEMLTSYQAQLTEIQTQLENLSAAE
ncbi:hypothetical protein [Microvirga splendida]|uniref:Uncharacterized protein n=1 Tax=Microvirga splendida TaxID=2795727 RepID=A0ABS0XXP9_9HYPH|nr:hypothetical protein [Microvirga splendida]MBJ6124813.1 hypothetical protein [Microvirga splendida]